MIDRDEVLHVARLARLALSDEEVERMSRELSGVLDHIEKISELELDGVPPTSHVIEVENVLRPDHPRPSWPAERILADDLTAGELFETYAERIARFDGELGAYLWKAGEPPEAALEADPETPLAG